MKKAIAGAAAFAAACLAAPAAAEASPATCAYDPVQKRVDVAITTPWSHSGVQADAYGHIRLDGEPCAVATVTNTDLIQAVDQTGTGVSFSLMLENGGLAPGAAAEPGAREIEVVVDLGGGPSQDTVRIQGPAAGGYVVAGSAGVNLNPVVEPEGAAGTDADLTLAGVERLAYVSVDSSSAANIVTGQGGRGTGGPFGARMHLEGGAGLDALWGGSGRDVIIGHAGADVLRGYADDDKLVGDAGHDVLTGGSGSDTASYSEAPSGVDVDLDVLGAQDTIGAGADQLSEIENLEGSPFDDQIRGTSAGNRLEGLTGSDLIVGRDGNDWVRGGAGDDRLRAGAGDDIVEGQEGRDVADYADAPGGVTLDLGAAGVPQPKGSAGADVITGVEDVDGSPFADVITGDGGANALRGGGGGDNLVGAPGPDLLDGGAAADQVDGADGEADEIPCDPMDARVVDPIDNLIGCAAPPTDPGGADPGGGTTMGTSAGTTGATTGTPAVKPRLAVKVLRPTARSRRRGVRLRLEASADVTASVRLRVSRPTARRLGLRRVLVGRANVAVAGGSRRVLVVAVRRKALRAPLTMRAIASDAAGQRSTPVSRRIAARIG